MKCWSYVEVSRGGEAYLKTMALLLSVLKLLLTMTISAAKASTACSAMEATSQFLNSSLETPQQMARSEKLVRWQPSKTSRCTSDWSGKACP